MLMLVKWSYEMPTVPTQLEGGKNFWGTDSDSFWRQDSPLVGTALHKHL